MSLRYFGLFSLTVKFIQFSLADGTFMSVDETRLRYCSSSLRFIAGAFFFGLTQNDFSLTKLSFWLFFQVFPSLIVSSTELLSN